MKIRLVLITVTFATTASSLMAVAESPEFSADVRPILSDHCFACHGPDEADRQADLRLDTADGLANVVEAGDVDASELIRRLESTDPEDQMPPPEFHKPLSAKQKSILKLWVQGGAKFQQHWAFATPDLSRNVAGESIDDFIDERARAAGLTLNGLADRRSLLRRVCLDLTGLPPTRQQVERFAADKSAEAYERLVDGLLQSPRYGEHMGRFWLDLVRYGDTHGLHLDNYREMWQYRDWVIAAFNQNMPMNQFITEQLAGDLLPNATRDQLIASGFNRLNVTTNEGGSIYDEVFTRNVIDRTDAFGTIFMGLTTQCAVCHDHKFDPITQRDYYSLSAFFNSLDGRAMDDNLKDPAPTIRVPSKSQANELAGYADAIKQVRHEMRGPIESVDAAQEAWQRSLLDDATSASETIRPTEVTSDANASIVIRDDGSVETVGPAADKDVITITANLPDHSTAQWQTIRLDAMTDSPDQPVGLSDNGNVVLTEFVIEVLRPDAKNENDWETLPINHALASYEQDGDAFAVSYAIDKKSNPAEGWAVAGHQEPGPRTAWFVVPALMGQPKGSRLRLQLKYQSKFAKHQFRRVRFSLSESQPKLPADQMIHIAETHSVGPFAVPSASSAYGRKFGTDNEFDAEKEVRRGSDVFHWAKRDDLMPVEVNELPAIKNQPSVFLIHQNIQAPSKRTVQLLLGADDGHMVFLNGKQIGKVQAERAITPLGNQYDLELKQGDNSLYLKLINHSGDSRLTFAYRSPAIDVPDSLVTLLRHTSGERTKLQSNAIRRYYRQVCCLHPDWLALQDLEKGLIKSREKLEEKIPTTLVWKELDVPRDAHVLMRGQYDRPGQKVDRRTPEFLPPMPEGLSRDRLGLATWLTSDKHPLTARVAVNRFWQQIFGTGLVKTSEDFGSQGEPPSHPRLLDWLAIEFQQSGWNVKQLMKSLVMTKAYRRDQVITKRMLEMDPENRLLARGPRHRLDAEVLRDQALAVSGLLNDQVGGPSVKPPQPDGLWYAVGYTRSNTAKFTADTGDDVYRRSVYIFWKRTSAPPQMSTFDAPSRESCTARRERTNTPLQALLLMNEQQYLEAAKQLAKHALEQPDHDSPKSRIRWMFETVTARKPSQPETQELLQLLGDLKTHYENNADAANELTGNNETKLAPWMVLASTILNLDEVVSK